jgi:hypothetical protein
MKMMTKTPQKLADWFHANAQRLRNLPAEQAAEELGEFVITLDERLGVEIADDLDRAGTREVIVTAFSDSTAFELVKQLVNVLSDLEEWTFVALKPPRGFNFKLSLGNHAVEAKTLEFAPMPGTVPGIRILIPDSLVHQIRDEQAEELAWLIVETGIGEELCGRLHHIELASRSSADVTWPISELAGYVKGLAPGK